MRYSRRRSQPLGDVRGGAGQLARGNSRVVGVTVGWASGPVLVSSAARTRMSLAEAAVVTFSSGGDSPACRGSVLRHTRADPFIQQAKGMPDEGIGW
jgi:hypothetical protein